MHIGDESLALSRDVKTACIDRSTLADAPALAGQSWVHALEQARKVGPNQASMFVRRFGFMMPHGR
jgi:hypothetical protein